MERIVGIDIKQDQLGMPQSGGLGGSLQGQRPGYTELFRYRRTKCLVRGGGYTLG